jgi:hypothetical protein
MSNSNLDAIARQVKALEKNNIGNVVKIGELLNKARDGIEHGEFMAWVSREFSWSYRTALRYERAYLFAHNCHSGTFEKLDLSLTALHLVADPATDEKARKAIIRAALKGRVTNAIARDIIEKSRPADRPDPFAIEPLPEERDSGSASPPASAPEQADGAVSEPVQLLQRLNDLVRREGHDWTGTIETLGSIRVREIVNGLRAALDRYSQDKAVKIKADRAEAALAKRETAQ